MQTFLKPIQNTLMFLLLITFPSHSAAQSTIHVDRNGSQAPDGSITNPYHLVEAGVCKAQPNDTVLIRGGTYNELFTIGKPGKPVTLRASGGSVVIGQVIGKPHTTLKVLTYNTHLFGDALPCLPILCLPTFADKTRAQLFADRIRDENPDVVGLEEVWDGDLKNEILNRSGFPFSFYGDKHQGSPIPDPLHSGLLLLSKHPIVNPTQIFYEAERGIDARASKGLVKATIVKDGFQIGVFLTHTQADRSSDDMDVRRQQLQQLKSEISKYQSENPGAEVMVMGDFNLNGERAEPECYKGQNTEYPNNLLPIVGLNDAFRNAPCFDEKFKFTEFIENDLERLFEPHPCNQRLDYILYSHGNFFDILPINAEVRKYQVSPPITEDDKSSKDLSDHYGLIVEFSIYR